MKNICTFLLVFGLLITVKAQDTWGPPFPLTDSLANNVNACLSIVPGEMTGHDTVFVFYERYTDASATAIWMRNLTTMEAPFEALSQAGVHFTHPRMMQHGYGDTLLFFSFETDQNGNTDIYSAALLRNLTVTAVKPFLQTSLDEHSLSYCGPNNFSWIRDGRVRVFGPDSDTILLSNPGCESLNLSCSMFNTFEMPITPDTGIFYSSYNSITHTWSSLYPADAFGSNKNPTMGNDAYGDPLFNYYVMYQHRDTGFWTIKVFNIGSIAWCDFPNFPDCNNYSPTLCNIEMLTDKKEVFLPIFAAFTSDFTGNSEIYVNNQIYNNAYDNISGHSGDDEHPQLFNNITWAGYSLDNQLFLIWESKHGGNWQLWATRRDVLSGDGGVLASENEKLLCKPNPFNLETAIEFLTQDSDVPDVAIFDFSGRKITDIPLSPKSNGRWSGNWNGTAKNGEKVPAGIYFCTLQTGGKIYRTKVIKH